MTRKYETVLTPAERSLRSRMGAHTFWSTCEDRAAHLAKATHASQVTRFELQVDPDGTLEPAERARRAEQARKAYMSRLAFLSAKARRERKAASHAAAT
jgi:hypothetical protein